MQRPSLTEGSISRGLLLFALPILYGNVLQTLNASVNSVWVGRFLGEVALTATANANSLLFLLLGEFSDYQTALYHSGVNFATLGYGDIVMSERWRLLGPIEAANGILMFGLSTAVMTATVVDLIKFDTGGIKPRE